MKFKKSIALIISIVMICASLTSLVTAASVTLTDISGHWGEVYIQKLVDEEIIKGYEDGTFRPDNPITRAEFCTIITKALVRDGLIEYTTVKGSFNDVADDSWYVQYVETAASQGWVSGKGDGKFDPEAFITRQEMAKIISLVYCQKNPGLDYDTFTQLRDTCNLNDYNLSDIGTEDEWATPYIKVALKSGVMTGNSDGTFAPQGLVTRAQTATVTYRILYPNPVTGTPEPTVAPTPTEQPTPVVLGPIREHGTKLAFDSVALINYPDYVQPNANSPAELLIDGIANDDQCFTCEYNEPEYLFDLGEVNDIQSFAIKGFSTAHQSVFFRLLISADNLSWIEFGAEAALSIAQPIIDDPSIYTLDNFDSTTGAMLSGTPPTKFDVTTEDEIFLLGNYQLRTLRHPEDGSERDVDCFASPILDRTLTTVNWAQYGFVDNTCDYLFHYFADEVYQARYIKIIGYGNTMTQWYMFSSLSDVQVFGPGASYEKEVG